MLDNNKKNKIISEHNGFIDTIIVRFKVRNIFIWDWFDSTFFNIEVTEWRQGWYLNHI